MVKRPGSAGLRLIQIGHLKPFSWRFEGGFEKHGMGQRSRLDRRFTMTSTIL